MFINTTDFGMGLVIGGYSVAWIFWVEFKACCPSPGPSVSKGNVCMSDLPSSTPFHIIQEVVLEHLSCKQILLECCLFWGGHMILMFCLCVKI